MVRPRREGTVADPVGTAPPLTMKWLKGRLGSGYEKLPLLSGTWPLPFDSYLIRYREGDEIKPHVDPVQQGRHFRLNVVVWKAGQGGEFVCKNPIFETKRIKLFRPDLSEHSVTRVTKGSRYVFSLGWVVN